MKKLLLIAAVVCCGFLSYGQSTIAFQDFESGTDDWAVTENPTSYTASGDVWAIVTSVGSLAGPSAGVNFWGMQDLDNGNGGGPFAHTLTFSDESITGFTNVSVSFDYHSIGFDGGSGDELTYELIVDGVGQGETLLDPNTLAWVTVTETVSATSTVGLVLSATQNGGSDYAGFDNVILSGAPAGAQVVGFDALSSETNETDASFNFDIPVSLSNYGGSPVELGVSISGGTADANDYNLGSATLTFNSSSTQNISLTINSDDDFSNETIELTIVENSSTGALISTATHTITVVDNEIAPLVINEINADAAGDSNGDGTVDSGEDEFVEIVNSSLGSFDISGWTVSDNNRVRHTFPEGTVLKAGAAVVVFGGGMPSGAFGGAIVQTASTGSTGFNNGGDDIVIGTPKGTIAVQHTYGSEAGNDQSITLDPDITGSTYVQHSTSDLIDGSPFSPGTKINGAPFIGIAWLGVTDANWSTASNWDGGVIPTSADDVIIPDGAGDIIVDGLYEVNDLTVGAGSIVNISGSNAFAVYGAASGDALVSRSMAGSAGLNLFGSAVTSAIADQFAVVSPNYVFSYDGTAYSANLAGTSEALTPGEGFFIGYDAATSTADVQGTLNSGVVTYDMPAASSFAMVANPYAAPITYGSFEIGNGPDVMDGTIYLWQDGGSNDAGNRTGTYVAVNSTDLTGGGEFAGNIASSQGFFVFSGTNTTVTFNPTMQTVSPGSNADYFRSIPTQKLRLAVSDGSLEDKTLIALSEEATFEKDYGMDAYKLSNPTINVFSSVAGENFAINTIPTITEETAIAIGISVTKAGTYTMSVAEMIDINGPAQLLDKVTGNVYDLNESTSFEFTTDVVSNELRFELSFNTAPVLSAGQQITGLSAFGSTTELTINYPVEQQQNVAIYTLDGKVAFQETVNFRAGKAVINPTLSENQLYILRVSDESIKFIIK